jgi:hypothetical protein
MSRLKVDPGIVGCRFSDCDFSWDWQTTQLIARAAGASLDDERDRRTLLPGGDSPGHLMIPFNGALLARNRPEVMDRLIGGYDNWQDVGRWGAGNIAFRAPVPRCGRGRVGCGFTDLGATSKGHALARFSFEVDDAESGTRLADGWMLLFLLDCAPPGAGKLAAPRTAMPERPADHVIVHPTSANVPFDWAMPSDDWNTTHFEAKSGNPAPLVHGTRNMALTLQDAARIFADGHLERIREITLGSLPAPHFPGEATQTRFWREAGDRILGCLAVPGESRIDGGDDDKVVIDQITMQIE